MVIRDKEIEVGFVHMPMSLKDRMDAIRQIADMRQKPDLFMGDWNTFPDIGGPKMISTMVDGGWIRQLPEDTITFKAFPHDLIAKPASFAQEINPESKIVETKEDGTLMVQFASLLDHVFTSHDSFQISTGIEMDEETSDHALVYAIVDF